MVKAYDKTTSTRMQWRTRQGKKHMLKTKRTSEEGELQATKKNYQEDKLLQEARKKERVG